MMTLKIRVWRTYNTLKPNQVTLVTTTFLCHYYLLISPLPTYVTTTYLYHHYLHMSLLPTYITTTYICHHYLPVSPLPSYVTTTYLYHHCLHMSPLPTFITTAYICHHYLHMWPFRPIHRHVDECIWTRLKSWRDLNQQPSNILVTGVTTKHQLLLLDRKKLWKI